MEQKRVNYFQGMMLVDDDFKEDQAFHRQMLAYHNLELHTWGVVRGFEVSNSSGKWDVTEGVAIDAEGKRISWKGGEATPAGTPSDGCYIVVEWSADLTDPDSQNPGNFLRWIETCTFSFKTSPETIDVVLARIRVQPRGIQFDINIDNSVRRTATSVRVNQDNNSLEIRPVAKDGSLRLMTGLTERLTIDRDGKVGIGTTGPTQRLQVEGGDILVKGAGNFFTGQEARLYFGDTNHYIKAINGSGLRIGTLNAVDGISLLQGGNVGIGTADPGSSRLKIGNTPTDFVDVRFAQSGTGQLEIVGWGQGWSINAKSNGKHLFLNRDCEDSSNVLIGRNGKELFVRGSDGKVGIGTNDPQAGLHIRGSQVAGSSQGVLNLEGLDHVYVQLYPLGFANGRKGWMGYGKGGEKSLTIQNEITDGHILLNAGSGRVGIGTAAPAAAFQVRGTPGNKGRATFFNDVAALFACKTDNGGSSPKDPETVMVLAREGVETQSFANFVRFDLGMYGDKKTQLNIRLNHDSLDSEINNTPVVMSLRSNSNVGIGTSKPAAKLEIQGGAGSGGESDPQALAFSHSNGGYRHWIRTRHNSNLGPRTGNAIDFYVNNSATVEGSSAPVTGTLHALTLDSGKVGIGTTSPATELHIRRDVVSDLGPTLFIQNAGGSEKAEARIDIATYDLAGGGKPNFRLSVLDDGRWGANVDFTTMPPAQSSSAALVSRLYIKSDGNIGIATKQPKAKLEIQGGADSGGASNSVAFSHRNGGFRHWIRTRHNSTPGKGNAIDFYLNNSATADGSSETTAGAIHAMTLDGGKVGIGITDPQEKLDVGGDIRIGVNRLYFTDRNHGISAHGEGNKFGGVNVNGPVVYGWGGGALGSNQDLQSGLVQKIALRWDEQSNVNIGNRLQVGGIRLEPGEGSPNAGHIRFGDSTGWKLHFGQATSGATPVTGLTGVVMTLQDQGNVGIGTTNPGGRLEIRNPSTEVKVKFGGTGGDVHHLSSTRDLVFNSPSGLFTFRKVTDYGDVSSFVNLMTITSNGNISSPRWRVSNPIKRTGPLPISGTFTSGGGTLLIFVSGSGVRSSVGTIGMDIFIDGVNTEGMRAWTNERDSHHTFVPFIVWRVLDAKDHTIELKTIADTWTDSNDYFYVTVLELPI